MKCETQTRSEDHHTNTATHPHTQVWWDLGVTHRVHTQPAVCSTQWLVHLPLLSLWQVGSLGICLGPQRFSDQKFLSSTLNPLSVKVQRQDSNSGGVDDEVHCLYAEHHVANTWHRCPATHDLLTAAHHFHHAAFSATATAGPDDVTPLTATWAATSLSSSRGSRRQVSETRSRSRTRSNRKSD